MAGRIPDNFVQDLLSRVDLVDVVRSRITLKKSGRNYTACCPFHNEKTPSFSVAPDKQFYYCFGCGCSGNAIGFVMEYEQLNFPQAVEQLAAQAGMEVPREKETPQARQQRSRNELLYELLERAGHFFSNQLQAVPTQHKVRAYLKQRGLDASITERYQIGYAPPGFDTITTGLSLDKSQQELALTGGLLAENEQKQRRYDKFRDRLIFPIRDARGRTVGFGGRVLDDSKPKYLNSPETPVFHKGRELYGLWEWRQTRRKDDFLLVVEGYMDVVSLAQFGIPNAVATLGTATSEVHLRKLFREVDQVVFCFDGDKAGRRAAWRALESTLGELTDDKQVRFLFLPEGEDPDTLVRSQGPEAIRAACDKAQSLDNFLFGQLGDALDLSSIAGRARLAKLAMPFISRVKGSFYQQLLEKALAERTGIQANELDRLVQPEPAPTQPTPQTTIKRTVPPVQRQSRGRNPRSLIEQLLLLLIHFPALPRDIPLTISFDGLSLPHLETFQAALDLLNKCPATTAPQAKGLFMSLPHIEHIQHLLTADSPVANADIAAQEWQGGILQLQLLQLDFHIQQLQQDKQTNPATLFELLKQREALKNQRQQLGRH